MPNYPKEQLWELYKNLPEDLQKATFSEEVANNIQEICFENGITDDDTIFEIAKNIGYVFLGLLPPNELENVLEKELKIKKDKVAEIASKINRFVFLPVRESLEALYKIEIEPGLKIEVKTQPKEKVEKKPKKKDKYLESIE